MTAWEVLKSCIERLRVGGAPEVTPLAFVVMGATMVINLAVSTFESRQGERLGQRDSEGRRGSYP